MTQCAILSQACWTAAGSTTFMSFGTTGAAVFSTAVMQEVNRKKSRLKIKSLLLFLCNNRLYISLASTLLLFTAVFSQTCIIIPRRLRKNLFKGLQFTNLLLQQYYEKMKYLWLYHYLPTNILFPLNHYTAHYFFRALLWTHSNHLHVFIKA